MGWNRSGCRIPRIEKKSGSSYRGPPKGTRRAESTAYSRPVPVRPKASKSYSRQSANAILPLPPSNELDYLPDVLIGNPLHGRHVSELPVMRTHPRLRCPEKCIIIMVGGHVIEMHQRRPFVCRTPRPLSMASGTFLSEFLHATAKSERYAGTFRQSGYRTRASRAMVHPSGVRFWDG